MKIFNEKKEYFWEYEYPFYADFLKNIFDEKCIRKYSLIGDGIFNLVLLNDKIYDISLKESKSMLVNDGKKAFRDETKDTIIKLITDSFDNLKIDYTVNSGKFITFKIYDYIGKIEVVKKTTMPK